MGKSFLGKIQNFFGSKKEEKGHEEIEEKKRHSFVEDEEETRVITENLREEDEIRGKEEIQPHEAVSEDKTSRPPPREEEGTHLLAEGVEKEEALPSDIKIWQEGEVIEDLYEVKEVIGTGGMGVVYIVDHRKWNVPLAVKSPRQEIIRSREGKSRFFREAETWIDLGKHPDIATAYYVRTIAGIPHVFIEYVNGGNLKDWIEQGKIKDWETILRTAIEFCNGMAYAHDMGLIHRDIKPANVLVTKEGKAKITDFGLIKGAGEFLPSQEEGRISKSWKTMTGVGGIFGTPAYMSPEQWDDPHGVGREADIYSFGVMLYEMISGKRPFEPSPDVAPEAKAFFYKKMHQEDQPSELKKLRKDIEPKLEKLVLKCIENEKETRYRSFEDVKTELEEIYEEVVGTPYHAEVVDAVALKADDFNNKALSFLDLGVEEDAVRCWQEALKLNPHHMEATFNIGYWEWRNAKITDDQYIIRLNELESSHANNPIYWHSLGLIHLERGDLEECKKVTSKAMELDFKQSDVYNVLGITHLCLEEINNAKEAFIEAVQQSPDKWQSRFYLALTLFQAGERERCLEEVSVLLGNPKWNEGLKTIGITDVDKILEYFTEINILCTRLVKVLDPQHSTLRNSVITSAVFSPDGKYALFSGDKTLQLWDVETGECIRTFEGPTREVNSAIFSPDGRYVLSGSNDTMLRLWSVKKGECIRTFEGHTDHVVSVALSPDGRHALSGSSDNTLRLWDVKTGECIRTFGGHTNYVSSVAFSPDGRRALSGSWDKTIRLWDVETGECIRIFGGTWQLYVGEKSGSYLKIDIPPVNSVAFSPDGRYVLSGSREASPRLWDVETGKCLILPKGPFEDDFLDTKYDVQSVSFSPDGRFALFGGDNIVGLCALWDVKTGKRVRIFRERDTGHRALSVAFSPDGRYALSGDNDSILRLWDVKTGECVRTFGDGGVLISQTSVAFSPDGRYALGIHGFDHYPRMWDIRTGECVRTFEGPRSSVFSVAFSPDGKYILSGSHDEILRLWDVRTGECIRSFRGYTESIWSVAFSPDSRYALGSGDKTLRLWDVRTGECVRTFEGHTGNVSSVTFSPDGRYVLSGAYNCLRLWDVRTGECIKSFEGYTDGARSVAFSPDGLCALSVGSTLRLWDIRTGRCVRTFKENASASVAFSPDGYYALSGGTLSLWSVKYSTDISIYPRFDFILCSPMDVLRSARDAKEVKELITQARSLMELESFSQAYRLLRKAQECRGFERSSEIMKLITPCSNKGKIVGIRGVWFRKTVEGPSSGFISGPYSTPAISPNGNYVIFKGDYFKKDYTFTLLDIKTGERIKTFEGHTSHPGSFAFSPDGRYILSAGDTNSVSAVRSGSTDFLKLWDIKTGECIKTVERPKCNSELVEFSPDGKYAISSGSYKTILLWDVKKGVCIRTFEGHSLRIGSIAFSPGGKYVLSSSADKTIRLWDVSTGECIKTFVRCGVSCVAFTPNGKHILSRDEKTLRLWDVETGKCTKIFKTPTSAVTAVFTPDGRYLLTGRDRNITLTPDGRYVISSNGFQTWEVETGKCVRTLEKHTLGANIILIWELDWELEFDENRGESQ